MQDKGVMRALLRFVLHVARLWQRQKNGSVDELDGKQRARLLPGCLVFEAQVVSTHSMLEGGKRISKVFCWQTLKCL